MAGQFGNFTKFTVTGMDKASDKLEAWQKRGLSDAVRTGIDEYGFRLGVAAYSNMKKPTTGRNDPWYVGLRWKKQKQFHSPPAKVGEATWQIQVRPQYLALWQEVGTKPHVLFNPNKLRAKAFWQAKKKQERRREKIAKLGWQNGLSDKEATALRRAERERDKLGSQLSDLQASRGLSATMGYSDPSYVPKGNKRNANSDWFKGNTPVASGGKRAGQPRPVTVRADTNIMHPGTRATKPIERGVGDITSAHRLRMAALLKQAYERRG